MSLFKIIFNSYFRINPWWIVISIIVGLVTYLLVHYLRPKMQKIQQLTISLLSCYIFLVLSYMVFSRHGTGIYKYELIPFWSYKFMVADKHIILSAVLNAVLFMPIGFLLPVMTKSYRKALILGFLFSIFVDLLQLVTTTGTFEFDDIFHNTIGLCVGCWVLHQLRKIIVRRIRHNKIKT